MKITIRDRLLDRASDDFCVRIGRYYYRADMNTGEIFRCHENDMGRRWVRPDGSQIDGWRVVGSLSK